MTVVVSIGSGGLKGSTWLKGAFSGWGICGFTMTAMRIN